MNTQQIDEKAVFNTARRIADTAARDDYLTQACGGDQTAIQRIRELLRIHEQEQSFLESPAADLTPTTDQRPITEQPGAVIGPYKLLQQIGEGGMGVVFMAEQSEPIQRTVALKIIKPGMDTRQVIARFEAERQALAMMDHPNIARVIDAGTTETGRPYFVMELVKGVPITKYCDDHKLSLRDRLELFKPVCEAVQHAHQKGIIHRDIKPTNVLVAEYDNRAVPKVIDFGVAKATAQKLTERTMFTEFGQVIGTVEYMSPEQAKLNQLDIDTRSDIYSLGVLLYELLTGSTPFERQRLREAAFDEVLRIIREEEPPKPSTRLSSSDTLPSIAANRHTEPERLSKDVRGELDWIVMKCLDKDRNRRYETANGLTREIERYLTDEPVQACPPSAVYRFRKFARRNKTVLATTAVVAASLVLGTVVSLWQARRAVEAERLATQRLVAEQLARQEAITQRSRAEANLRKAREAVDQMLSRVGIISIGDAPPKQYVGRQLLEDALKFYQGFLDQNSTDPELRLETGRAWQHLGTIHRDMGQYAPSQKAHHESIAILEKLVDEFPHEPTYRAELAVSYDRLGEVYFFDLKDDDRAEAMVRKAMTLEESLVRELSDQPYHRDRLAGLTRDLAESLQQRGRFDEAEKAARRAVEISEEVARDTRHRGGVLARCYAYLGELLRARKKDAEADVAFREALAIYNQMGDHATQLGKWDRNFLATIHRRLARSLHEAGRNQEAEEHYRSALAVSQKLASDFPDGPFQVAGPADCFYDLGLLLHETHRPEKAAEAFRQARELFEKAAKDFPDDANRQYDLAELLTTCPDPQIRDPDRAVEAAQRALQMAATKTRNWKVLGIAQYRAGNSQAAVEALNKAIELDPDTDNSPKMFFLAMAHWQLGHKDEARTWYDKAVEWMDKNQSKNEELLRFRADAAELLGISEPKSEKASDEPREKPAKADDSQSSSPPTTDD